MKIYESAVRKPISTVLIFVGVLVMGLFSLTRRARKPKTSFSVQGGMEPDGGSEDGPRGIDVRSARRRPGPRVAPPLVNFS